MIKECNVLLNNTSVTVVSFDGVEIQFPSIKREAKTVFVKCENGRYSIVDKDEKPKSASAGVKKSARKKTTVEGSSKSDIDKQE